VQYSSYAQDTITIDLEGKAKVMIYTKDKEGLRILRELDLNKIIRDATAGLDSSKRKAENERVIEYDFDEDEHKLVFRNEVYTDYNSDKHKPRKWRNPRVDYFWLVDIGLNNYLENGKFPDSEGKAYGLNTTSSRYFAVGTYQRSRIGGDHSPFGVQFGVQLSWYNFMFTKNNYILAEQNGVDFRDYQADFDQELEKSKLVVSYVNIPVMFNAYFRSKHTYRNHKPRKTFNVGLGGYAGYRVGGYAKRKVGGDAKRDRDNYYLNNWHYGLEAQVGYRYMTLFMRYDLNPLFVADKGPELNAFSFGIRI
jgi:hypothetical protein